ncbi:MAG: DUF378 domain-containing protein [Chlamydiia bacterium]|nr:DUF378 domain-containing protein [Chlamydiia bacterium]
MKVISWIAMILVVIGALNWGMIGFFGLDVVGMIFGGAWSPVSRVVYALVGLSGIWAFTFFRLLNYSDKGTGSSGS